MGNRTSAKDANLHEAWYRFDELNRLWQVEDHEHHLTEYGYDEGGNRTSVKDANTHTTVSNYDGLNRLLSVTDPLQHTVSYTYDKVGNRLTTENARHFVTQYGYDDANRLRFITDTLGYVTEYRYNPDGSRERVIDAKGHTTRFLYDHANRLQDEIDWLNQTTHYDYDAAGNRTSVTNPLTQTTAYQYDDANRVKKIIFPGGNYKRMVYDGVGNKLEETDVTAPGQPEQTTVYTPDELNRVHTVENPLGEITTYAYDDVSNLEFITDASGLQTQYEYDSLNRLHFKRTPSGANQWQSTEYLYDPAGNLQTLIQPSGARRTYEYDAANRLQFEWLYSDATSLLRQYEYAYNENNNRTDIYETRYNPSASYHTTYHYTDRDEVDIITDGYGGTTTYHYDEIGDVDSMTDPSGIETAIEPRTATTGEVTTHYETINNVRTLIASTTNHYDGSNRLDGWTTTDPINNLTLTTELPLYDNGYVKGANITHQKGQATPVTITSTVEYKDNNLLGNMIQQGLSDTHYDYDGTERLKCAEHPDLGGKVRAYLEFDPSGNRLHRYENHSLTCAQAASNPQGGDTETYTPDGYRLAARTRQSLIYNFSEAYEYDEDGNLKTVTRNDSMNGTNVLTYAWEIGTGHLLSVTRARNGTQDYSATLDYDHLNRIRKFCEGNDCQLFFYIGDSDWISFTKNPGDGATLQRYLYANGRPIRYDNLAHYQHPSYYFRYNARGDMAGYVQKDGSSSGWRTFGAWGDKNDAASNQGYYNWNAAWGYMQFPLSFNFNQHDEWDMGLYFAHGRWYNQDTGLWLSPNEKGDYLYGGDGQDPINRTLAAQLSLAVLKQLYGATSVEDIYLCLLSDCVDNYTLPPPPPRVPFPPSPQDDFTSWLVAQMHASAESEYVKLLSKTRNDPQPTQALRFALFYNLVAKGMAWDFKPDFQLRKLSEVTLAGAKYEYDVPSNVLFGYVGIASGFQELQLLGGAGMAQVIDNLFVEWGKQVWSAPLNGKLQAMRTLPPDAKYIGPPQCLFDECQDAAGIHVGMELFQNYGLGADEQQLETVLERYSGVLKKR